MAPIRSGSEAEKELARLIGMLEKKYDRRMVLAEQVEDGGRIWRMQFLFPEQEVPDGYIPISYKEVSSVSLMAVPIKAVQGRALVIAINGIHAIDQHTREGGDSDEAALDAL